MLGVDLVLSWENLSRLAHTWSRGLPSMIPSNTTYLAFSRGTDPVVVCLSRTAWSLWLLGYPDQALSKEP